MTVRHGFAFALQQARRNKGYTQEAMAELCSLSLRHYQTLEAGRSSPRMELFLRICQVLHLHPEDFYPAEAEEE